MAKDRDGEGAYSWSSHGLLSDEQISPPMGAGQSDRIRRYHHSHPRSLPKIRSHEQAAVRGTPDHGLGNHQKFS
ncbi:unnamed protein product [Thlaspi arvense]|uniref:Uncharacterized protein n=1 Tax=Thlaspi arvense TaxID=13288 RepID=A0AAU9SFY4_THLAR|nr:unnamed protein product [Thlaspi arvense]